MKKNIKLIPAIIQDSDTKEVLMFAYMSRDSLEKSIATGTTWFWSRNRKKIWNKGETSGNLQKIKEIKYDCDNDTLLIMVDQTGNACHTGNRSCFYNELKLKGSSTDNDIKKLNFMDYNSENIFSPINILYELCDIVESRIKEKPDNSYTYLLHKKGLDEIIKKIGEESTEVILASKHQTKKKVIYEIADLIYHLIVLMVEKKIKPDDIFNELKSRRK
ncbi:MAG: bifunctional phosphoribosyl-AMP cyclohydrolase/phosphoribosyl-ATP diphosphatase HisIE [Actinobacteria bacterium]|nr:bifunctional phosphoribosyl-AMP cyclohydrolase/phosphoribosyl-ATP diphosphatase HisIE [Actinomycetota bacterium]